MVISATWSWRHPSEANIPDLVSCCQFSVEPSFSSPAFSWVLIAMILSAIPFSHPPATRPSGRVYQISAASLAPCLGGWKCIGRIRILHWTTLAMASSWLEQQRQRPRPLPYRPMFLASSGPAEQCVLVHKVSGGGGVLVNISTGKPGRPCRNGQEVPLDAALISFHCSRVGPRRWVEGAGVQQDRNPQEWPKCPSWP